MFVRVCGYRFRMADEPTCGRRCSTGGREMARQQAEGRGTHGQRLQSRKGPRDPQTDDSVDVIDAEAADDLEVGAFVLRRRLREVLDPDYRVVPVAAGTVEPQRGPVVALKYRRRTAAPRDRPPTPGPPSPTLNLGRAHGPLRDRCM